MVKGREHLAEKKSPFENGSTRSAKLERFDLIPPEAEVAAARRFGLGSTKHGEGNWKGGGVAFIKATICHLKAHVASLTQNDPASYEDSDTDAIVWNAMALCWFRERKPKEFAQALQELRDGLPQ